MQQMCRTVHGVCSDDIDLLTSKVDASSLAVYLQPILRTSSNVLLTQRQHMEPHHHTCSNLQVRIVCDASASTCTLLELHICIYIYSCWELEVFPYWDPNPSNPYTTSRYIHCNRSYVLGCTCRNTESIYNITHGNSISECTSRSLRTLALLSHCRMLGSAKCQSRPVLP